MIDDLVAIDAGSLATSATDVHRGQLRDIVLTHAHLDHVAGLPLFIDDLFATLTEPVRIYAAPEIIEILERDIFNWSVYPRFSELSNKQSPVLCYSPFHAGKEFNVRHLSVTALDVNHKVPSTGFVISDTTSTIVLTGDTAEMDSFWSEVNALDSINAVLIECAFPDELTDLADISHHLTPSRLSDELSKFEHKDCPVYVINMKPMYREEIVAQIQEQQMRNLHILEVGREYCF
ncbi:MAG: MBL fold metallo-hydrolase [Blastocatellia bacterium]